MGGSVLHGVGIHNFAKLTRHIMLNEPSVVDNNTRYNTQHSDGFVVIIDKSTMESTTRRRELLRMEEEQR